MKQILLAAVLLITITLTAQRPSNEPEELKFNLDPNLIEQEVKELSQQTTIP